MSLEDYLKWTARLVELGRWQDIRVLQFGARRPRFCKFRFCPPCSTTSLHHAKSRRMKERESMV